MLVSPAPLSHEVRHGDKSAGEDWVSLHPAGVRIGLRNRPTTSNRSPQGPFSGGSPWGLNRVCAQVGSSPRFSLL